MQGMTIEFNPTSNLGVSFTQLLFSGSYIVGIQSAKLYEEITRTSFEQTEMEILAQVTQAYYLSLIAEESRAVIEENLDNMNDLLGKTRAMVDVGMAEEVDYDQLSVQFGMLNDALRAADRQLELSLNMLRLQMGLAADVDIILTDGLVDILEQSDFGSSMTKAFELQSNPDYRLIALQTEIAEKQINMERAAYLPTLSGFYNYTEKLLKPEFDITPNHVIGLNMNIPIFSSGVRQARVRQARLNFEIAENQQELISEQLLIQEKQLRYNLNNAFEQYESQKKNLEVARRVYDNINDKYRQGMLSSLDLTTANNNYLQAENSYIAAVLQLLEAQVEMDKLLQLF
jgi:outer membrane protein